MNKEIWSENGIRNLIGFERHANTMVVGPTSSGKTTLLKRIVSEGTFTGGEPTNLYIACPRETSDDWKNKQELGRFAEKTHYIEGIPGLMNLFQHSDKVPENSIVIFDDFMTALEKTDLRRAMEKWFSVTTNHRKLWTFLVTHDMFYKSLTMLRRNTHNFILFNVLQSDYRSASDFCGRLLGQAAGSSFLALWQDAVSNKDKGWIRLDQKLQRGLAVKTVVSTSGVTLDTVWIAGRSATLDGPIYIDSMTDPSATDNPQLQIPDSMVVRQEEIPSGNGGSGGRPVAHTGALGAAGGTTSDGASDLQQSDGR